jgi:hypothetical protein
VGYHNRQEDYTIERHDTARVVALLRSREAGVEGTEFARLVAEYRARLGRLPDVVEVGEVAWLGLKVGGGGGECGACGERLEVGEDVALVVFELGEVAWAVVVEDRCFEGKAIRS